jgi:putative membrane protein
MMGPGMGLGIWGWVLIALLWGGLVTFAVLLVRALFPHTRSPSTPPSDREPSAFGILELRYARGELTREEYELMRQTLSENVDRDA